MKKQSAWTVCLASGAVMLGASSACTLTIDGGDDGGDTVPVEAATPLHDASIAEADTGADSAAPSDTATPEAGDEGSCTALEQLTLGSMGCDTCVASSCCGQTTVCFAGAENSCADLVSCLADCLVGSADAGIAPGDTASCSVECEGPDGGQPTFESFVSCVSGSCPAQCQ